MIKHLSLFAAVAVLFGATPVMAATNDRDPEGAGTAREFGV